MQEESKNKLLGISQSERSIIDTMTRLGKLIVRAENLEDTFGFKRSNSNLLLSRLAKKGWLQRLGPGIYRILQLGSDSSNPIPDDPLFIAMELFSPCYASGWTSAEHWDLTEQIFNSIVIYTKQKQRKRYHKIAGINFITKVISPSSFFGTTKIWSNNSAIQIADIHKTIIDIMDDPEIGGGGRHAIDIFKSYYEKKEADTEVLWKYAQTLNHGAVFKRIGFLIEKFLPDQTEWIQKFHSKIKSGVINFDVKGPEIGPVITKWGIRLNIPSGDVL
jgi:predicted transcriptional regulator of viral defense system